MSVLENVLRSRLGDDLPEGIRKTPARWEKAIREMTSGYDVDVNEVLSVVFDDDIRADEMVVLRDVPFSSLCEHHLLPFSGFATVGYLPSDGRVVGLSKLARLVLAYARRFQVQERMTRQIAEALNESKVSPLGVGVVVRASHSCMACRGVRSSGEMVTSALLGRFRAAEVRAEFLSIYGRVA